MGPPPKKIRKNDRGMRVGDETGPADIRVLSTQLLSRILSLCRIAKASGLGASQGRVIDAVRAVSMVDLNCDEDFRLALRTNLAATREEEKTFDRLFDEYWYGKSDNAGHLMALNSELLRGDIDQGLRESHEDIIGRQEDTSDSELCHDSKLVARWDDRADSIAQTIKVLAKRLSTRPSRRTKPAARGRGLDLRRSLRRNMNFGFDLLTLLRVQRRIKKTRLVVLCDVSGSMDAFNPFLLQLMLGLQKQLPNSRTVVFSTEFTEITHMLRHRSVDRTLQKVGEQVRHWSGGTNIGAALHELNRRTVHGGAASSTVAIIISDGYDSGEPVVVDREMRALKRRVRSIVWINPMYGATSFEPRAQGLKAALPHVDYFLPAYDAQSLRVLVRGLSGI